MSEIQTVKQRPNFNYIENSFELDISPQELRQIADEMDQRIRGFCLPGQVIRYKLNNMFTIYHKPEVKPLALPPPRVKDENKVPAV